MEKTIFLFQRHKNRDKQDFARHYTRNHAPLGTRLVRSLLGYTVNIIDAEGGFDANTEHWLEKASDLLDPEISYATREDYEAVVADDRTLFDSNRLFVATDVTEHGGTVVESPLGEANPEAKFIWLYAEASDAPPPPAEASRVVDNHVAYELTFEGGQRREVAPEYRLIRMAWADNAATLGPNAAKAIAVREFPYVAEPRWPR